MDAWVGRDLGPSQADAILTGGNREAIGAGLTQVRGETGRRAGRRRRVPDTYDSGIRIDDIAPVVQALIAEKVCREIGPYRAVGVVLRVPFIADGDVAAIPRPAIQLRRRFRCMAAYVRRVAVLQLGERPIIAA